MYLMNKIDFKKQRKDLFNPSAKAVSVVTVPAMNFLMLDGMGDPATSKSFEASMEALYPMAFTLKFMSKQGPIGQDYVVPPLEGLWWADDMMAFKEMRRDEWKWTLMIMQPDFVSEEMVDEARAVVRKKKAPALLDLMRFETFTEGESVQVMHLGPYDTQGPKVDAMHEKIADLGKEHFHKHHEIYLSDPRRCAPEKLKTVLRQAIR